MGTVSKRLRTLGIAGLATILSAAAIILWAFVTQVIVTSHQISTQKAIISGANASIRVAATHTGHYWPELALEDTSAGRKSNRFLKGIAGGDLDGTAERIAAAAITWSISSQGKTIPLAGPAHFYFDGHGVILVAGTFPVERGAEYSVEAHPAGAFAEIAPLRPRLQVQADPGEVMGIIFETVFLIYVGILVVFIGLILLVMAYVFLRRSRHRNTLAYEK